MVAGLAAGAAVAVDFAGAPDVGAAGGQRVVGADEGGAQNAGLGLDLGRRGGRDGEDAGVEDLVAQAGEQRRLGEDLAADGLAVELQRVGRRQRVEADATEVGVGGDRQRAIEPDGAGREVALVEPRGAEGGGKLSAGDLP